MRQITERRYVSYCVGGQCYIAQMNVFLQDRYVCYGSGINIRKIIMPNLTFLPSAKEVAGRQCFYMYLPICWQEGYGPWGVWSKGGLVWRGSMVAGDGPGDEKGTTNLPKPRTTKPGSTHLTGMLSCKTWPCTCWQKRWICHQEDHLISQNFDFFIVIVSQTKYVLLN